MRRFSRRIHDSLHRIFNRAISCEDYQTWGNNGNTSTSKRHLSRGDKRLWTAAYFAVHEQREAQGYTGQQDSHWSTSGHQEIFSNTDRSQSAYRGDVLNFNGYLIMKNPQQLHMDKHGKGSRCLDLHGKRFGQLRVIKDCGLNTHGSTMWLCVCDCGKVCLGKGYSIKSGAKRSCGCLKRRPKGIAAFNRLFDSYKRQAHKRGISFELSTEEARVLFKGHCQYCGDPPDQYVSKRFNGDFIYNGIDRVDSSQPYRRGNCVSCCGTCNWMKNKLTLTEFLEQTRKIVKHCSVSTVI